MKEQNSGTTELHPKDKLYGEHFKTKELETKSKEQYEELLCHTCKNHDKTNSKCLVHYKVWKATVKVGCDSYELDSEKHKSVVKQSLTTDKENLQVDRKQVGGTHYNKHKIQPWDIVDEYDLDYWLGNVLKYLLRDKCDRLEDLKKAQHYLEEKIKRMEASK